MNQINADPKGNWYRLAPKKTDQQTVHWSVLKVRLDQGETRSEKNGVGHRQECCLSPILFNLHGECLTPSSNQATNQR